jgi:hypothetical protein
MAVYCVVYDYYEELDIVEVFTDKKAADALAAAMGRSYSVVESRLNS